MRPTPSRLAWLALLVLLALAPRAGAADAPFLWRVQGPSSSHFLMGSVHLLPRSAYPLPQAFELAWQQTSGLVLETDLAALNDPVLQARLFGDGQSPNGLATEIPAALYEQVRAALRAASLPDILCDAFRAWLCAMTLGVQGFLQAGMDPGLGLDQHFHQRALADGRPMQWLESPQEQIALFAGMPDDMARRFLAAAVADADRPELQPDALVRNWRANDQRAMLALVQRMEQETPGIHERLLAQRNHQWMRALEIRLGDSRPWLVVAGAAHFVGPQGLVEQLRARGYRVEAVEAD